MANIWLFPYRAGEFGGAAFLIPYIIFVVLIGFTGVIGEMAFGRAMQSGPLGAFKKAYEMRGSKLGTFIADPRYRIARNRNRLQRHHRLDLEIFCRLDHRKKLSVKKILLPYSENFPATLAAFRWHLLGLFLVLLCMSFGVARGIEKVNRIMMPAFLFSFYSLQSALLSSTVQRPGIRTYSNPTGRKWPIPARGYTRLGQAFFSLSLAGSGTVVYGSYLKSDVDVVSSAKYVAFFDTAAALLAGLVIIRPYSLSAWRRTPDRDFCSLQFPLLYVIFR